MEPQTITIERGGPAPRGGGPWMRAVLGALVAIVALGIVFAAAGGERSADRSGTTVAWEEPPPTALTLPDRTTTTTSALVTSTVISFEEATAGPQLVLREVAPPGGLVSIFWLGEVGGRMAAVGALDRDGDGLRGVGLSWSDTGVEWSHAAPVVKDGRLGGVVSSGPWLMIAIVDDLGAAVPGTTTVVMIRDALDWYQSTLGGDVYPMAMAVGDRGATVFGERNESREGELLAAVPDEVRSIVDEGSGRVGLEGGTVRLHWNFGLSLWEAPADQLGLEGLSQEALWTTESVMFVTDDRAQWVEEPAPFLRDSSDDRWWAQQVRGFPGTGVVPYLDNGGVAKAWWTEDGLEWEEGDVVLFDFTPTVTPDRTYLTLHSSASPTVIEMLPDGTSMQRRFRLPSGTEGWLHDPIVGGATHQSVVWPMYLDEEEPADDVPPVRIETLTEEVTLLLDGDRLLVEHDGEVLSFALYGGNGFEADLRARTMRLLTDDGETAAEFRLNAIQAALEDVYRSPPADRSALLLTPDGDSWGIQLIDGGAPTAVGSFGDQWVLASEGTSRPVLHIGTWAEG